MRLSATSFERVQEALADAFGQVADFEQIARRMDRRLADIVNPSSPLPTIIFAMIERAELDDAVEQLVESAKKQNPHNQLLAAVGPDDLTPAPAPAEVVKEGEGTQAFKRRLVETLGQLNDPGLEALAAHELLSLLEQASDSEATTLYLALVGVIRSDRDRGALRELVPVFASALRCQIGEGGQTRAEVNLARVRLPRVNLANLDLHEADLSFADLSNADLGNVNLWRSRAYGVEVSGADLARSNLEEARWHAVHARRARFQDCRMVSVFLKDADLSNAAFQQSRLQGAHFERANLTGAHFEDANISDATFSDACIDEAAAKSLARAVNWDNARFDSTARDLIARFAE